jgi:hypothetical protein
MSNLRIKINYKQIGGMWSEGDYVQVKDGKGSIISTTTVGPGEIRYNVKLNDGRIVSVPFEELRDVELTPRKISSSYSETDSDSRSIGTSTEDLIPLKKHVPYSPPCYGPSCSVTSPPSRSSSIGDKDILALIALNAINENIRDSRRITVKPYSPYLESPYRYDVEDIGDNEDLKEDVTEFFYNKTLKWLDKDIEFAKVKKTKKILKTKKGESYIYKILGSFVKKNNVNWYELRDEKNFEDVKDHIRLKLGSL